MIFLAVVNSQPRELGLAEAIQVFIDHRIDVVQRRTVFLLRKAREREHILEGYKIALDNLDAVIKSNTWGCVAPRRVRIAVEMFDRLGSRHKDRQLPCRGIDDRLGDRLAGRIDSPGARPGKVPPGFAG